MPTVRPPDQTPRHSASAAPAGLAAPRLLALRWRSGVLAADRET